MASLFYNCLYLLSPYLEGLVNTNHFIPSTAIDAATSIISSLLKDDDSKEERHSILFPRNRLLRYSTNCKA